MSTWTVLIGHSAGLCVYTGEQPTASAALTAAAAAAEAWARQAGNDISRARYSLAVDGRTIAIVGTGVDDTGHPAHDEAAALLQSLHTAAAFAPTPHISGLTP